MGLKIRTNVAGDMCELVLTGEIDVNTAPALRQELHDRIEGGCIDVIVNLDRVAFFDSSGLGVLIGALRRVRERDGSLRIVCRRQEVCRLFRIMGLDSVFAISPDITESRWF